MTRRDRARRRHRDGLHRPAPGGADPALRDRAGRLAGTAVLGDAHGDLVPGDRVDLRRSASRRGCSGSLLMIVLVTLLGVAFGDDRRGARAADGQRLDRAGDVPARLRRAVPLDGVLPRGPARVPAKTIAEVQPALASSSTAIRDPVISTIIARRPAQGVVGHRHRRRDRVALCAAGAATPGAAG